jgi:peptidoglycan hydrolase CwlO-like protein
MTERIKEKITLPAIIAVLGLMVTLATITVNVAAKSARTIEKVETMQTEMNTCKGKIDDKVDKIEYRTDIERVYSALDRIEKKLDGHISNTHTK